MLYYGKTTLTGKPYNKQTNLCGTFWEADTATEVKVSNWGQINKSTDNGERICATG